MYIIQPVLANPALAVYKVRADTCILQIVSGGVSTN
jgi:hypothetical protein